MKSQCIGGLFVLDETGLCSKKCPLVGALNYLWSDLAIDFLAAFQFKVNKPGEQVITSAQLHANVKVYQGL